MGQHKRHSGMSGKGVGGSRTHRKDRAGVEAAPVQVANLNEI